MKQFLPYLLLVCAPSFAAVLDLSRAVVVTRAGPLANAENTAAIVLIEEIEKRTGTRLSRSTNQPVDRPAIAIASGAAGGHRPEGYRNFGEGKGRSPIGRVIGARAVGALFGAGHLLRKLDWAQGKLSLASSIDIATAPE